jgi:hypothetical protein
MGLTELLKLAALVGVDLNTLRKLVIEQGIPAGQKLVQNHVRGRMAKAVPKILANLATKAPLDGQNRKDKDGVEFEPWAYLCHESLYLLVKAFIRKGGLFVDGWRDSHLAKVLSEVAGADHSTPEAVVQATLEAEMRVTF